MADAPDRYVSRGGLKLEHALREFVVDPTGLVCADLGCSTGGFTDCLLQHGAAAVHAVDTAYGEFSWKLRNDTRVKLRERTNVLHAPPSAELSEAHGADLVVIDLGWTPQKLLIPAALRWLKPGGKIITLIKPHYEHSSRTGTRPDQGILEEAAAQIITDAVVAAMPALGVRVVSVTRSPIVGGASKNKSGKGNAEWFALVEAEGEGTKARGHEGTE